MMSERRGAPPEIADIIAAVKNQEPTTNLLHAAQEIVAQGFWLIGTVESQPMHTPQLDQKFYDSILEADLLVDEPGTCTLQVTWSGKLAVLGGVFGDLNRPEDKRFPEFSYGWHTTAPQDNLLHLPPTPEDESHITLDADIRTLNRIRRQPSFYQGSIDIVPRLGDEHYYIVNELPGYRHGLLLTREPHPRVARLPVFGSDVFLTGIEARQPDSYKHP